MDAKTGVALEIAKDLALSINLAADGDIEGAATAQDAALRKIVSGNHLTTLNLIESTRNAWLSNKRPGASSETTTFPEAGRKLAEMFRLLCKADRVGATRAFHAAAALMVRLDGYEDRYDAISYAQGIAPLSPVSIANLAWQDLVDAINLLKEDAEDIAHAHFVQAVQSLAEIDSAEDRKEATATVRNNSMAMFGTHYAAALAKLVHGLDGCLYGDCDRSVEVLDQLLLCAEPNSF